MDIQITVADQVMSFYLIPLALLTLAENIFKHGNLKEGQKATIKIYTDELFFYVETDNAINTARPPNGTHTGLSNTIRRLHYAYRSDLKFEYGPDGTGRFKVLLRLPLAAVGHPRVLKAEKDIGR
jgi:two-component system LytT family sensor kinase